MSAATEKRNSLKAVSILAYGALYPSEAYISVRKAPACPVTVHGGKLDNSENNTTFYKGETVWVKTSRPEKGLKFNCWLFPADVETTDDPTDTAFFFTMPDHAVEVTANWELYTRQRTDGVLGILHV